MSIYSGSNCLTAGPAGKSAYEYARGGVHGH